MGNSPFQWENDRTIIGSFVWIMSVKQCHKAPMTGNGIFGMVYVYKLATGHRNFMAKKIGILGDILEIFNQQWGTWV